MSVQQSSYRASVTPEAGDSNFLGLGFAPPNMVDTSPMAPGYDPRLLPQFAQEQKRMMDIAVLIGKFALNEDWKNVGRGLEKLGGLFTDHALQKSLKLYSALRRSYKHEQPDVYQAIKAFALETNTINGNMLNFVTRYKHIRAMPVQVQQGFLLEWLDMRRAVTERWQKEAAALYPLYQSMGT